MGEVLGSALSKELYDAWAAAYWQLAHIMISREKEILAESHGWTTWRECKIIEKIKESSEITSFRFQRVHSEEGASSLPIYKPGQYISIMTDVPQFRYLQSRQYSLSDSPARAAEYGYRISIKREPGVGTGPEAKKHPGYLSNILHDEKNVGDVLLLSHPQGTFYFDPDVKSDAPIVLISAGVGLTPMVSILSTILLEQRSKRRLSWIHGARSSKAMAFGDCVRGLAMNNENISRIVFCKRPDRGDVVGREYTHVGRVDLNVLDREKELWLDDRTAEYYICGPESFMFGMSNWLVGEGVDNESVKLELFGTGSIPS